MHFEKLNGTENIQKLKFFRQKSFVTRFFFKGYQFECQKETVLKHMKINCGFKNRVNILTKLSVCVTKNPQRKSCSKS